jgi:hypothetical protein
MSHVKEKFKSRPTAEKAMPTLFWGSREQILGHYQEQGMMIDDAHQSDMRPGHSSGGY